MELQRLRDTGLCASILASHCPVLNHLFSLTPTFLPSLTPHCTSLVLVLLPGLKLGHLMLEVCLEK